MASDFSERTMFSGWIWNEGNLFCKKEIAKRVPWRNPRGIFTLQKYEETKDCETKLDECCKNPVGTLEKHRKEKMVII